MKRLLASTLVALMCQSAAPADDGVKSPPEGFVNLLQADLSGWYGVGTTDPRSYLSKSPEELKAFKEKSQANIHQHWKVENGVLINDGKGLYLTTDKNYGDFEFHVEYKTVPRADSGIYLRGVPQVQIWDSTEKGKFKLGADKGSGGLWNNKKSTGGKDPLVLADKPFGEWNAFRIIMVGERVTIYLNDKLVVDHAKLDNYFGKKTGLPLLKEGPIQLQTHGGEIQWRNIFIREIGTEEGNKILAGKGEEGFASAFDGKSFEGWKGPVNNYEIVDGAIRCKKGKGGTIHTVKQYDDFSVRFEFQLPPGGNNGLAIRYPGQGDTAYVGMCELQVLDNTAPKYAKLKPSQYHGSAYGMVPAHRGYLRKPGEWNFQEVTVVGSTIKVELNGTVILDTDLGKIKSDRHKGKDRTEGHFGFAGHSDPVAFRHVRIKEL